MNSFKWQMSIIAGIMVIAFYCIFTFTSLAFYPSTYSPFENWLSDLGNSSYNPRGAIVFNVGCVLTGIALFPFSIGFYKWYTDENWRKILLIATQTVGCVAAVSLIMVGVFSEDFGWLHTLWSSVFFILNLTVLVLAEISLFTHPKYIRSIAYYGILVTIISLLFIALFRNPILEWFTVFTALGYVGLLSYNMFRASSDQNNNFKTL